MKRTRAWRLSIRLPAAVIHKTSAEVCQSLMARRTTRIERRYVEGEIAHRRHRSARPCSDCPHSNRIRAALTDASKINLRDRATLPHKTRRRRPPQPGHIRATAASVPELLAETLVTAAEGERPRTPQQSPLTRHRLHAAPSSISATGDCPLHMVEGLRSAYCHPNLILFFWAGVRGGEKASKVRLNLDLSKILLAQFISDFFF